MAMMPKKEDLTVLNLIAVCGHMHLLEWVLAMGDGVVGVPEALDMLDRSVCHAGRASAQSADVQRRRASVGYASDGRAEGHAHRIRVAVGFASAPSVVNSGKRPQPEHAAGGDVWSSPAPRQPRVVREPQSS